MGNTHKLPDIRLNEETIDGINGELHYQSLLPGAGRADSRDHGVEGQLVTLYVYTQEAMTAWTKCAGDTAALDALRKVAAIACRALIVHGCPKRMTPPDGPRALPDFPGRPQLPVQPSVLSQPVAAMPFSVRASRCLETNGIVTLGDLIKQSADQLLETRDFGITSLAEIRDKLRAYGLKLAGD